MSNEKPKAPKPKPVPPPPPPPPPIPEADPEDLLLKKRRKAMRGKPAVAAPTLLTEDTSRPDTIG